MKISVIDDLDADRENACSLVREYLRARGMTAEITEFPCAEEFLAAGEIFDIALLDIFMDEVSGIEAARRIRDTNADMEIIFLTTSRDFAVEAFAVSASNYLIKPISRGELFAALDRVTRGKPSEPAVTLRCTDGLHTFKLRDVEFFEVQEHNLYINFPDGEKLTARMSMKQLREEMASVMGEAHYARTPDYVPCGVSFMVNLRYVVSLDNLSLTTKSGRKYPFPAGALPKSKNPILNFAGGRWQNDGKYDRKLGFHNRTDNSICMELCDPDAAGGA